jgi:hypothetical protein
MNGLTKLVIFTVVVITVACTAALLVSSPSPQEARFRRQAEAQRLIDQLTQASWNYYHERGEFPPGDGIGSASLVQALHSISSNGSPFMFFVDDMLTEVGDLRNPIAPNGSILYYRNNRECGTPDHRGHNTRSFDLWCRSIEGFDDGVNNWDSVIVSAP